MRTFNLILLSLLILGQLACQEDASNSETSKTSTEKKQDPETTKTLPYYGERFFEDGDTIYHQIPPFGLTNQHGDTITHKNVAGKIYLADFFFTSCPGQCPKMTAALKRVQQNCKDLDFLILSHTIDPARDSAETFIKYIEKSGVDDYNWHFLTAEKLYIKHLGEEGYKSISGINDDATEVGDNHSNLLYLIDKNRHIRGFYSGTDPKEVEQLIEDLRILSKE